MYFDFYDDRPDYLALNRDVARLEGLLHLIVAVSVAFFLDIVALIALVVLASMPASDGAKRAGVVPVKREPTRFVFMAPRVDRPSRTARPDAVASDQNRMAAARERSPNPTNPLPFSRGNTYERVEEPAMRPPARRPDLRRSNAAGEAEGQKPAGTGRTACRASAGARRVRRWARIAAALPVRWAPQARCRPLSPTPSATRRVTCSTIPAARAASRRPTSSSIRKASSSGPGCAGSSRSSSATGCSRLRWFRCPGTWSSRSTSTEQGRHHRGHHRRAQPRGGLQRCRAGRAGDVQPDATAAAGVPRRPLLLHRHVLLQRNAAVSVIGREHAA